MGLCASKMSDEDRAANERSRQIDAMNARDHDTEQKKIKLLLLGAGESGKTTVLKQMQIIYGKGFAEEELRLQWAPRINENVVAAMKALCDAVEDLELMDQVVNQTEFDSFQSNEAMNGVGLLSPELSLSEIGPVIKVLWNDPGIQAAWEQRSEFQIIESHVKYFEKIDAMSDPEYTPSEEDVLLCRSRTIGIVKTVLEIDKNEFNIFDVGGQRNERRKWIHCFDEVTAVIFVAALSEYDQTLFEDSSQNRMVEAIEIFREHSTSSWFKTSALILFLNKSDLFEHKLGKKPISSVEEWDDYQGPDYVVNPLTDGQAPDAELQLQQQEAFDQGKNYFLKKFLELPDDKQTERSSDVYTHVTCATNTDNVRKIFDVCKDVILKGSLIDSGFYA
eukprot:CAMPEP_0119544516 /NCGR_PEP_ID=MMETSP1344-20130328/54770_1 /TAXON_ID=236787 /ORGANISM="Florenciella parvula, Strain CCMP2471" /LENGTH=390 /DNA_ID=CAMNT_0007589019 /DNA_START=301 /DNA_END=1473 /DNA_ORIENTATION=+